jgi:hypothetical protein
MVTVVANPGTLLQMTGNARLVMRGLDPRIHGSPWRDVRPRVDGRPAPALTSMKMHRTD